MARIFKVPFATQGDKVAVPDDLQPDGSVSFNQGWGFDYERANTDPSYKPIARDSMNGLLHDITEAIGDIQRQGYADWSAEAAPYAARATVMHNGAVWISSIENNSSEPGIDANWLQDEYATKAEAEAGENNSKRMTPLRVKEAIAALVPASSDGIAGAASNLRASATGTNATISISADAVCVKNASNQQKVLNSIALSVNSATVGANGLDAGALAASTWYSVWVIWNGTTTAGLLSLNATAPTLPAGYTHKARVGWIRTDATANKFPLSFVQVGRRVQYKPTPGSNLTALPALASGVQGNPANPPTFVAVSTAGVVPPTAARIALTLYGYVGNSSVIAAPSAAHHGVSSTASGASPLHISQGGTTGATHASVSGEFTLESANIHYASSASPSGVTCLGWEDNL